jgi:hypothetical protein
MPSRVPGEKFGHQMVRCSDSEEDLLEDPGTAVNLEDDLHIYWLIRKSAKIQM